MQAWKRIIVHADMDAFFAAVEQLDRPELRGKALLIGHPGPRGVVSTASYEARPFGVGSAMSMELARRRCPQAIVVPPRFRRYEEVSRRIMDVLGSFSPSVESLSLDEAFLDVSGTEALFGGPLEVGRRIKAAIREATGLTVSVGVSGTKFVAKVASDHRKPDGLLVVPPEEARTFLAPLPLRRLWGVGPKTEGRLRRLGLRSIGEVATASPSLLRAELGTLGPHLIALAQGVDPRQVEPDRAIKSVGAETTLEEDILGEQAIRQHLLRAADTVAGRLRRKSLVARGVRLKLKTAGFQLLTRQMTLEAATDSAGPLFSGGLQLLRTLPLAEPIRLVGLTAFDLRSEEGPLQRDLFEAPTRAKEKGVDRALDEAQRRFGPGALRRASELE